MAVTIHSDNFLQASNLGKFDLILMNPPFDNNLWQSFIDYSLPLLDTHGILIAIVLNTGKRVVPYEHEQLIEHVQFKGTGKPGVVIKLRADAKRIEYTAKHGDIKQALSIPGIESKSMTTSTMGNYDGRPCIVLPRFTSSADWLKRAKIVTELTGKIGSGFTIFYGSGLPQLEQALINGGIKFMVDKFQELKKSGFGTYGDCRKAHQIAWLNEMWSIYGPHV